MVPMSGRLSRFQLSEGGEIRLTRTDYASRTGERFVHDTQVADTGVGMPQTTLEHLGEP